jgi:AraC-like DNA-binding protein
MTTFYQQQVLQLQNNLYPKDYLTEKIIRAKKYMDARFGDNISLDQVSSAVSLSKFHFIRLFKKYYGITPHQYLSEVRMMQAKKLLRLGATVSQTCYSVGFSSLGTFTGFFKKYGGQAPFNFLRKKATLKK